MGLPNVNIVFKQKAASAVQEGATGILAVVLKDTSADSATEYILGGIEDIPAVLSPENKAYLNQAFIGNPKEVKAVVIPANAEDYNAALEYLETIRFNFVTFPGVDDSKTPALAAWTKGIWENKFRKVFAVLPNTPGDHPAIINFATDNIEVGTEVFSASQYAARIAGALAGLSLSQSPTFVVFPEVKNVPKLTKSQADAAIDAGKLILYHDGSKVKIARGVTSLTSVTEDMGADWKKIKVARILAKIYQDKKETIEDYYIGKYANSYINKLLLVSALNAYNDQLVLDGLLDPSGHNLDEIDIASQRIYLKSIGVNVAELTDQQIKEANTRDQVFLAGMARPLDAIEDVKLTISL